MNIEVAEAVEIRRYRRGKSRSDEGSQHMPLRQGKLPMVFIFIKEEGKNDEDTFISLLCFVGEMANVLLPEITNHLEPKGKSRSGPSMDRGCAFRNREAGV